MHTCKNTDFCLFVSTFYAVFLRLHSIGKTYFYTWNHKPHNCVVLLCSIFLHSLITSYFIFTHLLSSPHLYFSCLYSLLYFPQCSYYGQNTDNISGNSERSWGTAYKSTSWWGHSFPRANVRTIRRVLIFGVSPHYYWI